MRLNHECGSHAACRAPLLAARSLSEVEVSALSTTAPLSRATSADDAENGRSRRARCAVTASWSSVTPPLSRRNAAPDAARCCRSSRSHGVRTRTDTSAGRGARRANHATRVSTAVRTQRYCCGSARASVGVSPGRLPSRSRWQACVIRPSGSGLIPMRSSAAGTRRDMSARSASAHRAHGDCTSITTMTQGRSEDSCAPSATPSWAWLGTTSSGSRPRSSTYGR